MNIERNIRCTGSAGRPFHLDMYWPEEGPLHPLIIFVHGFKGFKDWGCWDQVARSFAQAGFAFLKFNFSHNGTTMDNPLEFADLEAFGQNNFSRELDDLGTVLDWALSGEHLHKYHLDPNRVSLIGHSRGAATVLLKTREDERIHSLSTWAGVGNLDAYREAEGVEIWRKAGVTYINNLRTGQQMPLYFQLHEDLLQNSERLDMDQALRELTRPLLVVHGSLDTVVPYSAALHLYENSQNSELETLMGADHSFGGSHPWTEEELPHNMELLVKRTIGFFEKT